MQRSHRNKYQTKLPVTGPQTLSNTGSDTSAMSSTNASYLRQATADEIFLEQDSLKGTEASKIVLHKSSVPYCSQDAWRPWLLKVAFLAAVAGGLFLSGIALMFSTYSSDVIVLAEGDQVLVPLSTHFNAGAKFFCSGQSDSELLRISLLNDVPPISENITSYKSGVQFSLAAGTFQSWGLSLVVGTTLKLSICADSQVQFYILKGRHKMTAWSQQILYDDYDFHLLLPPRNSCDTYDRYKTHLVTVNETDVYFMLFSSSLAWRFFSSVTVAIDFNRTSYDTSGLAYSCLASEPRCVANLSYSSRDIALLELLAPSNASRNPFRTATVSYTPEARSSFYVRLYGGIFAGVVSVTVIYTLWRICYVACCGGDLEKKPLLKELDLKIREMKMRKRYRSLPQKPKPRDTWVVVTHTYSKESPFDVVSLESQSLLAIVDVSHPAQHREARMSVASDELQDSAYMRRRSTVEHQEEEEFIRQRQRYQDDQLMDSCLTNAGVSAI